MIHSLGEKQFKVRLGFSEILTISIRKCRLRKSIKVIKGNKRITIISDWSTLGRLKEKNSLELPVE